MIIIEGADCVGKSHFVESLCEHSDLQRVGMVPAHLGPLPKGWAPLTHYLEAASSLFVQDRFHMSELVYGSITRGGANMDEGAYAMIDARLIAHKAAFTVVITAENKLLEDRWDMSQLFDIQTVKKVNQAFTMCAQDCWSTYRVHCDIWLHCTEAKPYATRDELEEVVCHYLTERRRHL